MIGYISFWNSPSGKITECPGNIRVFPFVLAGVSDNELRNSLQQCSPFTDSGPCPGKARVQFASQAGMAVNIQRLAPQVSALELTGASPVVQPLRAMNRIPISTPQVSLGSDSPLAGQASVGFEIQHPEADKSLNSVLHFDLKKPKDARVMLTVHHGAKTQTASFPFGKAVSGKQKMKLKTPPQPGMGGVLHFAVHAHVQRKNKSAKTSVKLKQLDIHS